MKITQRILISALFIANANIIACLCELGKQLILSDSIKTEKAGNQP